MNDWETPIRTSGLTTLPDLEIIKPEPEEPPKKKEKVSI
jgi:hypothetical protein